MTKHVVAVNVSQENNNNNMCDLSRTFSLNALLYVRIRDSRGVPNDPVDGQVDQERHHTRKQDCRLGNKRITALPQQRDNVQNHDENLDPGATAARKFKLHLLLRTYYGQLMQPSPGL